MNKILRFKYILKTAGFVSLFQFILARIFGQSKFIRPASTVDIRRAGVKFVDSAFEFVSELTNISQVEISREIISEAKKFDSEIESRAVSNIGNFPINWNSESQLRVTLYLLVRILKPSIVVETGTANGSSAAAICAALSKNGKGKLITVDVKESEAVLVDDAHREFLKIVQTGGSLKELKGLLQSVTSGVKGCKIFLHDSDHSYFGQISDFLAAKEFRFEYLVSDDIDASLAFTDFANDAGIALFDTRKIIGGLKLSTHNF